MIFGFSSIPAKYKLGYLPFALFAAAVTGISGVFFPEILMTAIPEIPGPVDNAYIVINPLYLLFYFLVSRIWNISVKYLENPSLEFTEDL